MSPGILLAAWLVGTLGGLHCIAMCGGFVAASSARDRSADQGAMPLVAIGMLVRRQIGYHAGRVATYALLGAAFGAGGATALDAATLLPVQSVLFVIANIALLALAGRLVLHSRGAGWLQRAGARAFGSVLPIVRPLLRRPGIHGRIALGLIWGLVPCALVYSVLPVAMFAGGSWQGAAVMLAFGAGTLPNLTGAGLLINRGGLVRDRPALRWATAALLMAYGGFGIVRVFWMPETLAAGPFCLVP